MKQQKYAKLKILALLGITYVFAKFQGGFASWFLFYSCLTLVCYVLVTYLLMFTTLEVSRTVNRDRLQDGDDLTVTLRVKRKIWFPLGWNLVVEPLPDKLAGYYEPHRQLLFPWFRREVILHYVIPRVPRGYYQLTDCVVTAGDYFGFVQRQKTFTIRNEFLVYPAHRQITHWSTGDGRISGNMNVSHRWSDDVAAVRGVRDYQRGDRLSQIHWKASAHGMGLKTKEFEHQATNQMIFFFDASQDSYRGRDAELFELAVKLTASLVYYASRMQYPYGLIAHERKRIAIPPGNTQTHFFRTFDQLARIMPEGENPFAQAVSREAVEFPIGLTLAVITPTLNKTLITSLVQLSRTGRNVHLFWMHDHQIREEERRALLLLAGSKVTCESVHPSQYEQLKRIGGA
ncbi:DUF58 domain-containing protein [Brevibacillus humidisoli]|uniref:DUF58 domain-containing protein n=1 Tax=Brevibacillus humidisoli TaxID=2895522 RepID=UPI001E2BFFEC|nr:DUF58 domain-containing protein [Brevibacillus humidisoli]UFJ40973.1 DUF58 domain-containing protein [Brevibacillus humidisoli]